MVEWSKALNFHQAIGALWSQGRIHEMYISSSIMESILIDHFLSGLHGTWNATCHSWHAQCEICAAKIPNNLGWVLFDWYDSCVNTGTWIKKQVLCSKQLASKTVDNEGLTNKVIVEWPANTCIVFTPDAAVTRREIGIAADRDKTHFCWIPCK